MEILPSAEEIFPILNHVTILSGIGPHEQGMVASKCHFLNLGPNEIIFEQGEIGHTMFFIVKGQVIVTAKKNSADWKRINILGPGDVFGELAIMRDVRRKARITTMTNCSFLTIEGRDFLEAYQFFPPHSRDNIQLFVAKRLQEWSAYSQ